MPPAVVAAAVTAAATVGAAVVGSRSNSGAAKTQAGTADKALQFTREQEAERRREWDYQQTQARAAWETRQRMLAPFIQGGNSVLARYGITGGSPQMPASLSAPMPPPGTAPTPPAMSAGLPMPPQVSANPAGAAPMTSQTLGGMMPQSTQSPFEWNDLTRYGVTRNA